MKLERDQLPELAGPRADATTLFILKCAFCTFSDCESDLNNFVESCTFNKECAIQESVQQN